MNPEAVTIDLASLIKDMMKSDINLRKKRE